MKKQLNPPVIYTFDKSYQIIFDSVFPGKCSLEIGKEQYTEAVGGVIRSDLRFHKFIVPKSLLDQEREYQIVFSPILDRNPYFPRCGESLVFSSDFIPAPKQSELRLLLLADVHEDEKNALKLGAAVQKDAPLDGLILLGDLSSCSCTEENLCAGLSIGSKLLNGKRPVIGGRGNHELRGPMAHRLEEVLPEENGHFYGGFSFGCLDGVVLDCGEDKLDTNPEYGSFATFAEYRRQETKDLAALVAAPEAHGLNPAPKARLVLCHIPFCLPNREAGDLFDIEGQTYAGWTALCNALSPNLMLTGHLHIPGFSPADDPDRAYGRAFPLMIGTAYDNGFTAGTLLTLQKNRLTAALLAPDGTVIEEHSISL